MYLEMENIAFVVTTQRMEMFYVVREHFRLIWAVESPVDLIILDGMPNIINHIIELRLNQNGMFFLTAGIGLWMIQQSYEIPSCVAKHNNRSPVLPVVSEAPCPNGLIFTSGGAATVCSSSPVCDACQYGSCFSNAASPGGACGDAANNLVCGNVCCECAADKEDADGDATNGCEAEMTVTIQTVDPECGFRSKDGRTCPDFTTCILTNQNFESVRTVWDLSTVNAGPNMLEDKHEVKVGDPYLEFSRS